MSEISYSSLNTQLRPLLECLLFVATDPVTPRQVADVLGMDEPSVKRALDELSTNFSNERGLQVRHVAGGYQLVTRPEYAEVVAMFLQPAAQRLSRQALETLAIIAYRQPITMPEIDALRGCNSSGVLKTLVDRGLVAEAGRKDGPGRPILYRTTEEFLKHFGLSDLTDLPKLEEKLRGGADEKRAA